MKKRVLSLFLAITLCLTLTPTGALAAEGQPPEQTVSVTQNAETGAGENAPPANPEENPTEDAPAAAEKNTADEETGKETGKQAEQNEPTVEGKNESPALNDAGQNAAGGGIYVAPGSPTEGGGGTYIPGEDTRTEIWCVSKPDSIGRSYDGTTDGGTIPIDLTFTDGKNEIKLKEGTGFTAKKTFDSADAGWHTVTVEIALIGEAAVKYKLKAGEETFTIGGNINKAYPKLTVSLSQTTCTVGEKILPLLSVSGVQENAAVTYFYTPIKAGYLEFENSDAVPKIDENTAISEAGTYYVYAKTDETKNYEENRSATVELTVSEKVDPVASVTSADGTETTYGSFPDAWTAAIANNGSTLKLLADATLPNTNTDLGQSLTLDLNGYVLGSNGSLTVKSGAALTVRNAGAENLEKPVKAGLYLTLLVEKGGSFTCTDGGLRYLGLLSAGMSDYAIQLAEGESHCTFGGFAQGDESATAGDLLKATPGMALYGDYNGSDVRIERSTRISSGFTYLSFYVGPCSEHQMDANGTCIYCGASYVASVTASGGESTNYTSLDDALDAMKDGDTVTLLSDAEVTKWHSLSKAFTLELNGKTVTTQLKAELYLHARVIVQDSSTGKTGGMAGTALLNVQEGGDLIIQSGTFNGRITINVGKLTIKGGTFNQEVDLRGGDSDSVFFSGGTFANIWYPNSSGSFLDLLAAGYAFYDNDGKLVNVAEITGMNLNNVRIWPHQHTFTNGACACGYTCPHTSVDESGACTVCGKQFAASITEDNDVTYYDLFNDALVYATKNNGCTLKLLADVTGTTVMINTPFIFDLNGHSVDALSVDAKATIKDSGTTKGRIGKVTVSNEKVTDLTLGSLLEEGYAFKYGNGYWANDSYLQTTEGSFVTVEKAPIQSVNVYAKDKNNQEILTIAYGATGEVTLVSSCKLSETSGENLSCAWYKLTDDTAIPPLEGAAGTSYKLPADLPAGTHTYRVTCTSDHYSKSAEITITVTPISLVGATVTVSNLTYNGNPQEPTVTVKLGDETLSRDNDYTVQVTKQTDAGSYKLTIKGGGNYSGEIKDVEWKIEPLPISLLSVSSISKTYDGSADVTLTADKLTFFSKTASRQDITLPNTALTFSDAQFTSKQEDGSYLPSPEVGGGKALSFTMTLTSNNYVFEGKSEGTTEVSDDFATDDVNRFTITKAAAPTDIQTGTLNVVNGTKLEYTYDAKQLLPKAPKGTYGKVSYNCEFPFNLKNGYYVDDIAIKDNILTLTIDALNGGETGKIGTIPVYVTTDNYASFNLSLDLYAVNKITPVADGEITAAGITYGDALSKSTISGKMKDPNTGATVNGTFAWTDGTTKPAANDSYEAEWTFTPAAGYEKYATATGTVTIKVNKATPTFTAPTAQENLTYTGQEQALITAGSVTDYSTMQYSLTENGTYSQDIPTGTDAGAYTVWYRVIGDANHNDTAPASVAVRIGQKPLTITGVTATSKPYDGTTNADISSVTFDNVTLNRGTDYTVTANFDDASVDSGKNITATVTLMEKAAKNYALEQSSFPTTASITKAAAPDFTKATALVIVNGHEKTYTVTLPALPTLEAPKEYGALTYEIGEIKLNDGYYTSGAKVENGELTLPIQKNDVETTGSVGTVTVVIKSANYEDITLTVNVSAKNRITPTGTPTLSKNAIIYGDTLNTIALSGKLHDNVNNKNVEGMFMWADGTVKPSAGSYEAAWKFTPTDGGTYAETTGTVTITVNKAKPTGAPTCTKITTSGKTLADAPLAIGTIAPAGGTLTWDMPANTVVAANTAYGWTYTPADTANYKALTGSLTPYAVSSGGGGGGGSSAATPSVSDKAAKELKNAKEGSTVTIDMKGETKLPASVTKEIAGKDVTVELDMGGGMVWSFNGLDVPKGGVSLDLGVKTGTKTIPAKVIHALTGETTTIQLQLNHNGPFGMSLKLSVDLGKKHDGLYANLYFYNPKSSALEFRSAGMISGGKASWAFDHASDYAIVIDKESHEPMTFTDVPDTAYYAEAVNWAVAKKITEGVGNKLFGSNDPCTRAQIVTFLWRAAGSPGPKTMSGFSDVSADSYYAKAVAWAVENGITGGTGDGKFSPDATCTRAQAVTFLYRASGAPAVSGNAAFSDVATNAYYAAAVKWAEKNGITGGIGGGLFGSDNNCTRAQIVTFLYRNYQSK